MWTCPQILQLRKLTHSQYTKCATDNLANVFHLTSGKSLSITATGTLKGTVKAGAYVVLQVKYGLITLVKQTVDLCDQVKNVELDCPLDKGELTIKKDVDLPKEIPPVCVLFNTPLLGLLLRTN